jgi:hypothetical protein
MDNTKRRKIEEVIWLEVRTLLIVAFFVIGQRLLVPTVFHVAINVRLLLVVIQVLIEPIAIVARWAFYAGLVLDIVSGRNTAFRTLCGDDSQMFIGMRTRMSDDAWIAMSDTMDDGVFFDRMTAAMQG